MHVSIFMMVMSKSGLLNVRAKQGAYAKGQQRSDSR